MIITVAAHHAGAHWQRKSKLFCSICVGFSYFGMVGQPEIIIKAPDDHFLAAEFHAAGNITFQFRKGKVPVSTLTMLTNGTVIFQKPLEDICHKIFNFKCRKGTIKYL